MHIGYHEMTYYIKVCYDSIYEETFFKLNLWRFLDRHHAWRSLDPTLDIWSNFVKKKHFDSFF